LARILVIEDDVTFLSLLRVHLASAGHAVVTAEDAAVGLRAIVSNSPDLLILDLNVPFMDSFELLEAVRRDPMTRSIPVIVLTGRDDDASYVRAKKIGADGYFTKPVQREKLIKAIEICLAAAKSSTASN